MLFQIVLLHFYGAGQFDADDFMRTNLTRRQFDAKFGSFQVGVLQDFSNFNAIAEQHIILLPFKNNSVGNYFGKKE